MLWFEEISKSERFFVEIYRYSIYKKILGVGAAAAALWAIKPGRWFNDEDLDKQPLVIPEFGPVGQASLLGGLKKIFGPSNWSGGFIDAGFINQQLNESRTHRIENAENQL